MKISKKVLLSTAALSTQLITTPFTVNAGETEQPNDVEISKNATSSDLNATISTREIVNNATSDSETISEDINIDKTNETAENITVSGQSKIKLTTFGKFTLRGTGDLKNIVLFTPLSNEFIPTESSKKMIFKIVIPTSEVTPTIQNELASIAATRDFDWDEDTSTTDITSLGKIELKNNIISWGVSDPVIAKSLQNLDYQSILKTTFSPNDKTGNETKVISYLVLNDEASKSNSKSIIYKKEDAPGSPTSTKPSENVLDNDVSNAKKNAIRVIERNKYLTDEQKNTFDSLVDKTNSVDQINIISALAASIQPVVNTTQNPEHNTKPIEDSGASSSANATNTTQQKPDSTTNNADNNKAKLNAKNEIKTLSNLTTTQKSLYQQLLDTASSSKTIDKIMEAAKLQNDEQGTAKKPDNSSLQNSSEKPTASKNPTLNSNKEDSTTKDPDSKKTNSNLKDSSESNETNNPVKADRLKKYSAKNLNDKSMEVKPNIDNFFKSIDEWNGTSHASRSDRAKKYANSHVVSLFIGKSANKQKIDKEATQLRDNQTSKKVLESRLYTEKSDGNKINCLYIITTETSVGDLNKVSQQQMYAISYDILNEKITETKPVNTNSDISQELD